MNGCSYCFEDIQNHVQSLQFNPFPMENLSFSRRYVVFHYQAPPWESVFEIKSATRKLDLGADVDVQRIPRQPLGRHVQVLKRSTPDWYWSAPRGDVGTNHKPRCGISVAWTNATNLDIICDFLTEICGKAVSILQTGSQSLAHRRKWQLWPGGARAAHFNDYRQRYFYCLKYAQSGGHSKSLGKAIVRQFGDLNSLSSLGPNGSLYVHYLS